MTREETTPPPSAGTTISNCAFTSAANDNTRAAVEALAAAAKANADAIAAIAHALQPSAGPLLYITYPN